jgi:hypothetical protein
MLLLKYLLLGSGLTFLAAGFLVVLIDVVARLQTARLATGPEPRIGVTPVRWRRASRLAALCLVFLLPALSVEMVPSGMAGVRVSQVSGTLPGTLYPGVHFVVPFVHTVKLYATRDRVYSTSAVDNPKQPDAALKVQSREAAIGIGVFVRYRLDPQRFTSMALPEPIAGAGAAGRGQRLPADRRTTCSRGVLDAAGRGAASAVEVITRKPAATASSSRNCCCATSCCSPIRSRSEAAAEGAGERSLTIDLEEEKEAPRRWMRRPCAR